MQFHILHLFNGRSALALLCMNVIVIDCMGDGRRMKKTICVISVQHFNNNLTVILALEFILLNSLSLNINKNIHSTPILYQVPRYCWIQKRVNRISLEPFPHYKLVWPNKFSLEAKKGEKRKWWKMKRLPHLVSCIRVGC